MRKTGLVAGIIMGLFVVLQFIPVAPLNNGNKNAYSFISHFAPEKSTHRLLKASCFDCHSNKTEYPWYANLQPVKYFMFDHIKEGKEKLNFDELASYRKRKKLAKFKSIIQVLEDGSMPLPSYTLIHGSLSKNEQNNLISYFNDLVTKEEELDATVANGK
ncbi:heme-binding domain-containing protein [Sphingobacterium sp. SYP-B4668]|uniref:heme-binding domain-containing protein n=1 Tax=Sphingobacterium sp. SYP-B4668 TaxID=2996035 RepID=UPI0022DDA43A|nr:heme-binding domain-containing protein [Sphingobacterium sp. SYP-B4668]